jgi:hypothetical protein
VVLFQSAKQDRYSRACIRILTKSQSIVRIGEFLYESRKLLLGQHPRELYWSDPGRLLDATPVQNLQHSIV